MTPPSAKHADVLPPQIKRWSAQRKANLVAAVARGEIGFDQACAHFGLTMEEFSAWQQAANNSGLKGLMARRQRS